MRRREPLDPVAARELAAIDAALAGGSDPAHPVIAPEDAELAQLATLLVAERPPVSRAFREALDARVQQRFAGPASHAASRAGAPAAAGAPTPGAQAPAASRAPCVARAAAPLIPAFAATAAVALIALVVALQPGGGSGSGGDMAASSGSAAPPAAAESAPGGAAGGSAGAFGTKEDPQQDLQAPDTASGGSAAPDTGATAPVTPPVDAHVDPGTTGRKVEQSSTVELGAPADRVDDVAQDVLGVVARQQGIVDQSSVATSGGAGEARFELRIPAARLQATLAELSRLPDAHVLARTDDTLDVNQAYVSVQRRLDGAEAERDGLLGALRAAGSETETDRLKARLDGVEQQIGELQRSQRALDRRVDYSRVALTVRANDGSGGGGGGASFTPGSALDDAGRVLAVTAGVVVIAAAALVPLALLALCLWPIARAARRRRREQALDAT